MIKIVFYITTEDGEFTVVRHYPEREFHGAISRTMTELKNQYHTVDIWWEEDED